MVAPACEWEEKEKKRNGNGEKKNPHNSRVSVGDHAAGHVGGSSSNPHGDMLGANLPDCTRLGQIAVVGRLIDFVVVCTCQQQRPYSR